MEILVKEKDENLASARARFDEEIAKLKTHYLQILQDGEAHLVATQDQERQIHQRELDATHAKYNEERERRENIQSDAISLTLKLQAAEEQLNGWISWHEDWDGDGENDAVHADVDALHDTAQYHFIGDDGSPTDRRRRFASAIAAAPVPTGSQTGYDPSCSSATGLRSGRSGSVPWGHPTP